MATLETKILNIFDGFFLKNWFKLFLFTLLSYSFYIIEFLWGNHDWGWVKNNTPLFSGVFEGRFSQFILQTILTEGFILPILTLILSLAFLTLGIMLLLYLLELKKSSNSYLLIGLFASTSPYTISWLYFAFISLSCLSWPFFIILAFYLLTHQNNFKHKSFIFLTSTLLFLLSLGGYPPTINTIFSIFFIILINNICFKHYTIKSSLKKALPIAFSIIISLLLLLIIQYFLKKYNLQFSTYNTASLSLSNIVEKFFLTLKLSLKQFTNTTSFITYPYKYLTLCLSLTSVYVLIINLPKTLSQITFFLLSYLSLLLSTVLTTFLAANTIYVNLEPRIEFFGLLYIYIFAPITLLKQNNLFLKNLTFITLIILTFHNISTINYSAKIQTLGFKSETKLMNRITNEIEHHNNFKLWQKYTFIQGGVLNYRQRFYTPTSLEKVDTYTLSAPYIPWHLPSKAYKFYTTTDYFGDDFDVYFSSIPNEIKKQNPKLTPYLQNHSSFWPNKNSIFLQDNLIVLILTPQGLELGKNWGQ